jgi:iron(III) transport system permease protein
LLRSSSFWTGLPAALIIGVCCALPLAWMIGAMLLASPAVRAELTMTRFRAELLGRTLGYNGLAAVLATLMGLPAAFVLGRGRGVIAKGLWIVLPAALLMPSLSYAYGWNQLVILLRPTLRPTGVSFVPGGFADTMRCIWSLAAWLWAVPAGLIGLTLRRMDSTIQQQALLDGAWLRITLRQLLPAIIASWAVVTVLATQEFAVYEPTGISVVATEVRMVFDTGAISSPYNPIAGPVIQGSGAQEQRGQAARAAAAIATAIPLLAITLLMASGVSLWIWRASATEGTGVGEHWPRVLDAGPIPMVTTLMLLALNLGVPVLAMIITLQHPHSAWKVWLIFEPQVLGAIAVGSISAAVAAIAAFAAAGRWTPGLLALAGASFLVGGQLLAIADIRIYNRPGLFWAYDYAVPILAYIGRFGWLAVASARATWSAPFRQFRDMAALDGASTWQTARRVVWPLAWPTLLAGGMLVGALSLTEVPATVLITPQHPQVLTPGLMTWVHRANYDAMIEASLLMMAVVLLPALGAVALAAVGIRLVRRAE